MSDPEFERWKAELERFKINADLWKSGTEAAMDYAASAIKALLILNGGAALAFLALIGHLYGKEGTPEQLPYMLTPALLLFGWGAFFGPLTAFLSYACQFHYSQCNTADEPEKSPHYKTACRYHFFAVLTACAGLICFIFGMYAAVDVFSMGTKS